MFLYIIIAVLLLMSHLSELQPPRVHGKFPPSRVTFFVIFAPFVDPGVVTLLTPLRQKISHQHRNVQEVLFRD